MTELIPDRTESDNVRLDAVEDAVIRIEAKIDRVLAIHEMILVEVKNFKLPPMIENMFGLMGRRG